VVGASPQFPQSKCGSSAGVVRMVYACAEAQTANQNERLALARREKEVETGHARVRAPGQRHWSRWLGSKKRATER
jgi:hypothetical protein